MFAEQLLGAGENLRCRDFEGSRDLEDVRQRDVALAALYVTVVAAIETRLEGHRFLRDAALPAQLA